VRSRLRTTVTMLVLIGILCAGAWYGWTGLTVGDVEAEPEAEPTAECTTPRPVRVRARDVLVSVFNSGAPTGTGGRVMDVLNRRGFLQGEVEVAPDDILRRGAVIYTSDPRAPEVQLVARQFRRPVIEENATPPGPGVNVFIGAEFPGFRAPQLRIRVRPEPDC
jgi:LytR cell envelope-related transcriptional attenuator